MRRVRGEPLDPNVPVVVLSIGYSGLLIARSLGRLGVPVIGFHHGIHFAAARSRYWRQSFAADFSEPRWGELLTRLLDAAPSIGPRPVLLPTDDSSCLFVADHAELLADAFRLPLPSPGVVRALADKGSLHALCTRHAMPTPETLRPKDRSDVIEFGRSARFPVVMKGVDTHRFLRHTRVRVIAVSDASALLRYYDDMEPLEAPNLLLQDYIPGDWRAMWVFTGYFDRASECLFHMTGQKIRQLPPSGGITTLGVAMMNDALAEQSIRFMKAVGFRGIVDLDYKFDARTGEYMLLDVNPRVGANFRVFVDDRGTDVTQVLYRDMTSQPVPPFVAHDGRKWIMEDLDLLSLVRSRGDGSWTVRSWIDSLRGIEEGVWFSRDDPAPLLARGPELAAVALRRLVRRR